MNFAFEPATRASLSIVDSEKRFPINRVFCVGRNYGEHAREMGHDPDREPPFFFMKPSDAVCEVSPPKALAWSYPPQTENLHYECELVVYIGKSGKDIALNDAVSHVFGLGIGLDMTRRDLQGVAKKMGRPWEWGKAFDKSAPCGPVHFIAENDKLDTGSIWLSVNGREKQRGDIGDLIWSIPEVISTISKTMEIKSGDIIMTGTPAGVGPVVRGDEIIAGIDGLGEIALSVV